MRSSRKHYAIAALMAAGTVIAASPAVSTAAPAAYPTASLTKSQYLTANPTPSLPYSCISKNITLAAGNYQWAQTLQPAVTQPPAVNLAAGIYTWETCLDPQAGYYRQNSYLVPPSGATLTLSVPWQLADSGMNTWGDILDPNF